MRRIIRVTKSVAKYMEENVLVLGSDPTVPDMITVQRVIVNDPTATPTCEQNVYGLDLKSGWIVKSKSRHTCRQLFTE